MEVLTTCWKIFSTLFRAKTPLQYQVGKDWTSQKHPLGFPKQSEHKFWKSKLKPTETPTIQISLFPYQIKYKINIHSVTFKRAHKKYQKLSLKTFTTSELAIFHNCLLQLPQLLHVLQIPFIIYHFINTTRKLFFILAQKKKTQQNNQKYYNAAFKKVSRKPHGKTAIAFKADQKTRQIHKAH